MLNLGKTLHCVGGSSPPPKEYVRALRKSARTITTTLTSVKEQIMTKLTSKQHDEGRLAAIAKGVQDRKAEKVVRRELREAGDLGKGRKADPKSGKRKRQVARRKKRETQVVTPKQEFERLQPLFKELEYKELGLKIRDGCHESWYSYGKRSDRRRNTGRNAVVQAREVVLKPHFPIGHVKYHRIGSMSDQIQFLKEHAPHVRPERESLVGLDVLLELIGLTDLEQPTRIVPNRYVDKGGVQRVEFFEIPVPEYRNPGAIFIDRINGDRTLSEHRAFMIETAEEHKTLRDKRIAKRKVRVAKCRSRKAEENPLAESSNDIAYSYEPRQAPLRKRFSPVSGKIKDPNKWGVGNRKHQRRTAAMLRDTRREMEFDRTSRAKETARKLAMPDYSASVACNIAAFDQHQTDCRAKPDDPVMAGDKAAKLAAFKTRQVLVTEARLLKKQQREERRVSREEQVAYEKTW